VHESGGGTHAHVCMYICSVCDVAGCRDAHVFMGHVRMHSAASNPDWSSGHPNKQVRGCCREALQRRLSLAKEILRQCKTCLTFFIFIPATKVETCTKNGVEMVITHKLAHPAAGLHVHAHVHGRALPLLHSR